VRSQRSSPSEQRLQLNLCHTRHTGSNRSRSNLFRPRTAGFTISIKNCIDGSAPLVHRPVLQNEAPVRQQSTKISPQPEASLLSYPAAIPLSQRTLIQLPGSVGGRG
jgi:hypothetical protein